MEKPIRSPGVLQLFLNAVNIVDAAAIMGEWGHLQAVVRDYFSFS